MITEGQPTPPGATWMGNGWNFALFSRHATGVTLLLYDSENLVKPLSVFKLDPLGNETNRRVRFFGPFDFSDPGRNWPVGV